MKLKYILVFFVFYINLIFAQSISVDIGKSFPGSSFDQDWDSDYTIGLSAQFSVHASVNIKPFLNYCSFKFDTGPTSEGPNVRNFKVHKHNIVTFGFMGKIEEQKQLFISPYFQAGLGYMISNLEDIDYTWGDDYEATEGGLKFNSFMLNLGFGLQIKQFDHFNPFLEINYIFGYPDKKLIGRRQFTYFRLSLGIKFTFID